MIYTTKEVFRVQPAYIVVDKIFENFVLNNRYILEHLKDGEIRAISKDTKVDDYTLGSLDVLERPWQIRYVGKYEWGEGVMIIFLDREMTKVYEYYDVE